MNALITPLEELVKETEAIQAFAEITIGEDINEAVQRGNDLIVYIARTGKMLADAKYHLNLKRMSEAMNVVERIMDKAKLSAGVQNAMIDSLCKDEQQLVDWIERLNRTCTHQMEWCRTLVSKAKEEMRLAGVAGREFNQ